MVITSNNLLQNYNKLKLPQKSINYRIMLVTVAIRLKSEEYLKVKKTEWSVIDGSHNDEYLVWQNMFDDKLTTTRVR